MTKLRTNTHIFIGHGLYILAPPPSTAHQLFVVDCGLLWKASLQTVIFYLLCICNLMITCGAWDNCNIFSCCWEFLFVLMPQCWRQLWWKEIYSNLRQMPTLPPGWPDALMVKGQSLYVWKPRAAMVTTVFFSFCYLEITKQSFWYYRITRLIFPW